MPLSSGRTTSSFLLLVVPFLELVVPFLELVVDFFVLLVDFFVLLVSYIFSFLVKVVPCYLLFLLVVDFFGSKVTKITEKLKKNGLLQKHV